MAAEPSLIVQRLVHRIRPDSLDFQHLSPARQATYDSHAALRYVESPGYKLNQGGVGLSIHRRRCQPDLGTTIVHARKLRFASSRLHIHLNANPGTHARSVPLAQLTRLSLAVKRATRHHGKQRTRWT
jgi:hypothetical protein